MRNNYKSIVIFERFQPAMLALTGVVNDQLGEHRVNCFNLVRCCLEYI